MMSEQLPPHDDNAEEALLGSLLIGGDEAYADITDVVKASDFFRHKHRSVFDACAALFQRGTPINPISVMDSLSRTGKLEDVGGMPFLAHLESATPTHVYAEHYAQIVHQRSVMRQLLSAGAQIAALGQKAELDAPEALAEAEKTLYGVHLAAETRRGSTMTQAVDAYLRSIMRKDGDTKGTPVPTGFRSLDALLSGFLPGKLYILAARPSVGKSALTHNILGNIAQKGQTVLLFTPEMPDEEVAERFIAQRSGVPSHRARAGGWGSVEEVSIMEAAGQVAALPIIIEDIGSLDIHTLRGLAKRHAMSGNLALIAVDYLQLLNGSGGRKHANRTEEVSEISRGLKLLARDLNLPVVALSQLNRAVENRQDHEPQLSDLRESGSIEQDADVVMFLYRPDMYVTEDEWERKETGPYPRGIVEVIIPKHRSGPIGRAALRFIERVTKFTEP